MRIVDLFCVRCRGRAYEDDGALSCVSCGRLLAVLAPKKRIEGEYAPEINYFVDSSLKATCIEWLLEGEPIVDVADVSGISADRLREWRRLARRKDPQFVSAN